MSFQSKGNDESKFIFKKAGLRGGPGAGQGQLAPHREQLTSSGACLGPSYSLSSTGVQGFPKVFKEPV